MSESQEEFEPIHAQEDKNLLFFHRKLTDSVFSFSVSEEKWTYICKYSDWSEFGPKYDCFDFKKKRKRKGKNAK